MINDIPLSRITLDAELQPRAEIDRTVLENYVQLLVDGVVFPPVVVFDDGQSLWLADGFHRWHAHNVLELDAIATDIRLGMRRDALLYSLSANAKHGLPRNQLDYSRAYQILQRNELADPVDVEAVAKLLGCSVYWAEKLARPLKAKLRAERDAAILAAKDEGKSNREIARDTGVPHTTVDRVVAAPNPPQGGNGAPPLIVPLRGPNDPRLNPPADRPHWREQLEELSSGPARNWSSALRALRHINEQISPDYLFADKYAGFDHVFETELEAAFSWITQVRERFHDERNSRRRA
jgi:hypothetical protein